MGFRYANPLKGLSLVTELRYRARELVHVIDDQHRAASS